MGLSNVEVDGEDHPDDNVLMDHQEKFLSTDGLPPSSSIAHLSSSKWGGPRTCQATNENGVLAGYYTNTSHHLIIVMVKKNNI